MSTQTTNVVQGTCDSRFASVREEFERNFAQRDELGASVCVVLGGETVVDLWGGIADAASGRPWEADTLNVVMSCSKGVTALCLNMLIDRGALDPDRPAAHYWPEFAQEAKADIPVRLLASHQSGLFNFGTPIADCCDWEECVAALAATRPFHEPGTRAAYHGVTLGYLLGELIRRIDGRSVGRFLAEEVTGPLGLDLWIGIPDEIEPRVAPSIQFDFSSDPELLAKMTDPSSPAAQMFGNSGGWALGWDEPRMHAAQLPAMGAVSNARGLAGLYAPLSLDGAIGDVRLVRPESIGAMRTAQAVTDRDLVLEHPASYTMGFSKSWTIPQPGGGHAGVILGEDAFGTPGMGGNIGFADQSYQLAFAYTMNRHGPGTTINERGQSLIDAAYRALGSPGCERGFWLRPAAG